MNKGDRPRDPIWNDFLPVEADGKSSAKCKHCGHQLTNKVERMKNHLRKCNQTIEVKVSRFYYNS